MSIPVQSASLYTDLQGLNRLKNSTEQDSENTLRFVAQQFEAMFMQIMLKSAREFDEQDGLFDSEQTEFYQDWHDKQLAINLSSGKGIGIADMLVEQLRRQGGVSLDSQTPINTSELQEINQQVNALLKESSQNITQNPQDLSLESPEEFVRYLHPLAEKAAGQLGVSPRILLAQAALETGWGQRISHDINGESSHNLFNIKADARWNGAQVQVPTIEYQDGIAVREVARFRAYDSFEASFKDYVNFIRSSPRYQEALSQGANEYAYSAALAQAGYATDPDYANKIMNIVDSDHLNDALAAIKI